MKNVSMTATLLVLALSSAPAIAQTVPAEALAAEGQGRWGDALRMYQQILEREPLRADLWLRVSDIYAWHGQVYDSVGALDAAVRARPDDSELHARLSRAYAMIDRQKEALSAIRGALALRPGHGPYLKALGDLASWDGDYDAARDAYRRLLQITPDDTDAVLALARVDAWAGDTDTAVRAYRQYLRRVPTDSAAWLEAARAESWRGNDRGAYGLLQSYRAHFGDSDAYRRELAAVLTRGRRPGRALSELRPLLSSDPSDFDLTIVQALAYTGYGHGENAHRAFDAARALAPERAELGNLERQLRNAFGSVLQPSGTGYGDSDGLRAYRVPVSISVALASAFRVQTGYERHELRTRADSGLERLDGGRDATLDRGWAGVELRPRPYLTMRAHGGRQDSRFRKEWTYSGGASVRLGDRARVEYDREHSLMTISPRAVSLGIVRDADRVRLALHPSFSFAVDLDASREALSDSNERWALRAAPRFAVVRNQWLNLDMGGSAFLFGAQQDLSNGYYDPARYEFYGLTLLPYFKFSENHGLSVFLEAGAQKDEHRAFEPGGSAALDLTLGIYSAWMLKLNGSATVNSRLESGAFRGYGGGVALTRRF